MRAPAERWGVVTTSWRRGGALAWVVPLTVGTLVLAWLRGHGLTRTEERMARVAKAERSTSHGTTGLGSSQAMVRTAAVDAVRSSVLPTMVGDALSAQCAALGTIEHAISLVDGMVVALCGEADALAHNGADEDALRLTFLLADTLDTADGMKGIA
jgi:alpha-beta hydrolase superfamily lysophospholipase